MSETRAPDPRADLRRWLESPPLLALVVGVVYAGSVSGGWLGYDDDWLARDNVLLNSPDPGVAVRIWLDLGRDTRLALGAEYRPIRDLLTWVARAWLGQDAMGLRLLCLALYAGACAGLLAWARAMPGLGYPIGVWLFALHPVHAESVAEPLGATPLDRPGSVAVVMARYVAPSLCAHPQSLAYVVDVHGLDAASSKRALMRRMCRSVTPSSVAAMTHHMSPANAFTTTSRLVIAFTSLAALTSLATIAPTYRPASVGGHL